MNFNEEWGHQIINIPVTTLDNIIYECNINNSLNISFIKIDVEGGEFDVLLGSEKILLNHKPVVIFEDGMLSNADLYGYNKEEYFQYFERLGYILFDFFGNEYTINDWGGERKNFFIWLIHKDSEYLNYFRNNYAFFMQLFINLELKTNNKFNNKQ